MIGLRGNYYGASLQVTSGSTARGVPLTRAKFGAEYGITPNWIVGLSRIASSAQYPGGDEASFAPRLPPHVVLRLDACYRLTPGSELLGTIVNPTNTKHETYGTFSLTSALPIARAPGASNTRSVSPASCVAAFGGAHVLF